MSGKRRRRPSFAWRRAGRRAPRGVRSADGRDRSASAARAGSLRSRPRSTTPAASASSPICTTASRTTSSRRACRSCSTSIIAARSAPTRSSATAAACSCRFRTLSSPRKASKLGFALPAPGHYAVGQFFMPRDADARAAGRGDRRGGRSPTKARCCSAGATCRSTIQRPRRERQARPSRSIARSSSAAAPDIADEDDFERRLYHRAQGHLERASIAADSRGTAEFLLRCRCRRRTLVYKGMLLATQLGDYFHDLQRPALRDRRWRSCISASRPTPFRPGGWRIPIGWSRTTARSTRCAATSTGWRRGRPRVASPTVRQRHRQALADLLRGPVGHRLFRQCARIPRAAAAIRSPMR